MNQDLLGFGTRGVGLGLDNNLPTFHGMVVDLDKITFEVLKKFAQTRLYTLMERYKLDYLLIGVKRVVVSSRGQFVSLI